MPAVEFALIAEAGPLEAQALLLVEGLRRFGGGHCNARVTVVSPRAACRPSRATQRVLGRLGADYVELDVVGACPAYPTSWRIHAMAELERRPGPEVLVQLDSDTLFIGDVGPLCADAPASARPVDVKGMGTTGEGDRHEAYWAALCRLGGVDIAALGFVTTTVDDVRIRATHNAGFLAARRELGLFERADALFRDSAAADLRPHAGSAMNVVASVGEVGLAGSEWWGSGQAAMSVAAAGLGIIIGPLDVGVNVPVHMWSGLQPKPRRMLHIHYHGLLGALPGPNALLDGEVCLPGDVAAWLKPRVPLGAARWRSRRMRAA